MSEDKLSPKEAARKSMDQITGALVGIAMVLSAVFIPMAFFGGSVGVIYRQFSVTIVSAMVLSVVVAIVLTPALCATMLKPIGGDHVHSQHGFFGWFNRWFDSATLRYQSGVSYVIRRAGRFMLIYLVLIGGLVFMFKTLPTGFLPDEDQGMLFAQIQLPTGATQEETTKVLERVERYFLEEEKESIDSLMGVLGFSFAGNGQNMAMAFVRLKDWSERQDPSLKVDAVSKRAMAAFSKIRNAQVFAFAPPAIMELGNATGFDFQLQDKSGLGHEALLQARNQLLGMAAQNKNLVAVRPNGRKTSRSCASTSTVRRRRAQPEPGRHQRGALDRLGQLLRGRLPRQGPRQKSVRAGRRAVPYGSGRHGKMVLPQQQGRNGSLLLVRFGALGVRPSASGTLQRRPVRGNPWAARAGRELRYGHAGNGEARQPAASGHRLRMDRAVLSGTPFRITGSGSVRPVHPCSVPVPRGLV